MGTREKWPAGAEVGRFGTGPSKAREPDDTKELRQLVRTLRAENQRLSDLFDRAPLGFVTLDATGRVLEANECAERLFCVSRDNLLHSSLVARATLKERGAFLRHIHDVLGSFEPKSCQVTFEGDTDELGFVANIESIAARGANGQWQCRSAMSDVSGLWRDQRERAARLHAERKRRDAIEATRRRLDQVAVAGAQLVESLDLDTTIARAAQLAVPTMAAYCAIDLAGPDGHVRRAAFARARGEGPDLPLDPYAPRGSVTVVRTGESVVMAAPSMADLLSLSTSPDELSILREHVRSYLCVALRAHGRTLGAMSFVRHTPEITSEEVMLAEEIARHAALAIDNARLYREAQEADRRKDEFLAMLGHELRNPLAAIVFATARLKREAGDSVARKVADVVDRQGARLIRLVDDLVDVSRITRGKIALQPARLSLAEAIERAVDSTRPLVESKRHTLHLRLPAETLAVRADPARLEQVLVNLITNAAKYTNPGGNIEVCAEQRGAEVIVRVRDDGIGIPKDQLGTIFAPFSQIDATLDRTDRGLGIGLALAKSLVELHGGTILAESEGLGHGAEIVVRLPVPVDSTTEAPPRPSKPPPSVDVPRRRVLVVDDQADLAALLEEEIMSLGHDVRVAHDGLEAVGAAIDFTPELAFIDLGLPGLTGYEVAQRFRQEPGLANAKLVALTGYGGDETTGKCLEAGFDRHFTKPISEDVLRELLAG